MTNEITRILDEARDYPALAISVERAAEIALEVADLTDSLAELQGAIDAFVDALRRNSG